MLPNKYITRGITYPNEHYECKTCEIEYRRVDVEQNWKCGNCDDFIIIESHDEESSNNKVFIRKRADDVVDGDYVYYNNEMYKVLSVTILNGKKLGKIGIALKGYRKIEVNLNEYMACIP